jgi:Bacteriophage related domain of unknown function
MDLLNIRRAFEKAVTALSPELDTFYENVPSVKPTQKKPYQKLQLVPFRPENPTFGDNYYREVGEFQVFLCYPAREGTDKALQKAQEIRDTFFRGNALVEGGLEIIIKNTPSIERGIVIEDRYLLPVVIEYFASVLKP